MYFFILGFKKLKKDQICGLCSRNVTGNYKKVWLKILKEDTISNNKYKCVLKRHDIS